jgi:hypothetical protein
MTNEEIAEIDLEGWPVADSILTEVGRIALLWSTLEYSLNLCVGKLAGFDAINDPKHFILFTHVSFPQRLDMLSTLCEQLSASFPNLKDYKDVVSSLKSAQKLRTEFMHNGMFANSESGNLEMPVVSARGSLKRELKRVDLTDIRRASVAIHEAHLALHKLVLKTEIEPIWKSRKK